MRALEIHFINMVKYKRQVKDKLKDSLCRWLAWFDKNSPPELLKEVVKMDSTIQKADERMQHITQSEEDMWAYTRYMMAECDRTSQLDYAREEGFEEGLVKGKEEVLNLLTQGLSVDEIKQRLSLKNEE